MCFEGGDVSKGAWSRQLEEAKRDSINTGGRLQATDNRSSLMVTTMAQKYGRQLLQLLGLIYIILNCCIYYTHVEQMLEEQRGAKKQHLVFLEQPACAKKKSRFNYYCKKYKIIVLYFY